MKKNTFHIIAILILMINVSFSQGSYTQNLNNGWSFVYRDSVYNAKVPGNIFLDLYSNGIIDNPYFGINEQKVQWVSERKWEYTKEFDIDSSILQYSDIVLDFDGIDTYAEVFLNDKKILVANNMYRKWQISVKSLLKSNNRLKIIFSPPLVIDSIKAKKMSYKFPDSRAFTRKAPYQFGWDWGPKLVGVGIWKGVCLKAIDGFELKDIYVKQNFVDSNIAKLSAIVNIDNINIDSLWIEIADNATGEIVVKDLVNLKGSENLLKYEFEITNPKLWWPNGLGEPNIYEFSVKLSSKRKIVKKKIKIGLRNIKLVQKPDKYGETFYFEVNGKPVFAKGANYIPQDNFPSSVDSSRYLSLIKDAVKSNMNMLRVWGGGIYEKDIFYDLCDRNGIMVWQDFMYACNFYPGDTAFLSNAKIEATEQIIRLRNHPCIALWCGNNEIDEAWHNWGYQKSLNYSETDSIEIWNNYQTLFHNILPGLIKKHATNASYISTSPKIGWGHEEALLSGDMHYWGVWWGAEPFEIYKDKVGRFMSEYGFQAFPDIKTVQSFTDKLELDSPALLNHQKHSRGMQLIKQYMSRDFPVPGRFEDYVYMSQLVQAYGMNIAIEAHRRAKPYCMGTLYWQFNDSWPVISWSGIDYYGRWKALQYQVRRAYKTVIISEDIKGDSIDLFVVSDSLNDISGTMINTVMDFDGKRIFSDTIDGNLQSNSSKKVVSYRIKNLLKNMDTTKVLLNSVLKSGRRTIASKIVCFTKPKRLELDTPNINIDIKKTDKGFLLKLKSNTLVKNLSLNTELIGKFSDNYFDLLPNVIYTVNFETDNCTKDKLDIKTNFLNKFVE